jgi:hypothetical protein
MSKLDHRCDPRASLARASARADRKSQHSSWNLGRRVLVPRSCRPQSLELSYQTYLGRVQWDYPGNKVHCTGVHIRAFYAPNFML